MMIDIGAVDDRIVMGLAKLGQAVKSQAWRGASLSGLTPTQGQVLAHLLARPEGMGIGAIAAALGVKQPTASDAIAALDAKGLVRKRRPPGDRRGVTVSLTGHGRRAARASASWLDFLLKAVGVLDASERAVMLKVIIKMIRTLQEAGEIPVSRMCVSCVHFRARVHDDARMPHHCAFVDAALGDQELRLDCADHDPAPVAHARESWRFFSRGDRLPAPDEVSHGR